MDKLTITSCD